jgi:hypothetical protein
MSQSMLESQGTLMSPNNFFFFIWEIWGTLQGLYLDRTFVVSILKYLMSINQDLLLL